MASNDGSPSLPPSPSPPPPSVWFRPSFSGNFLPPMINSTGTTNTVYSSSGSSSSTYNRFFIIAVICLCLVSSMVLFLHLYLRYVRQQHMRRHRRQTVNLLRLTTFNYGQSDSPRAGLDRTAISSIPSYQYKKEADNSENSTASTVGVDCAVCLSLLEEGEVVRMLPACRHVFHVACIDKWLSSSASCPVCRADVSPQPQAPGRAQSRSRSRSQSQATVIDATDTPAQEHSGTKEETEEGTSVSTRLSSSVRRMLSSNRSSRRVQDDTVVEDLERGNRTNPNN
jgi:E3 ubiquitin-protein ligase ATL41